MFTTPITLKHYGKGYKFLQNMGYHGQESLISDKKSLVEPLIHTKG